MSDLFTSPPPILTSHQAKKLLTKHFGITGTVELLTGEKDLNFKVHSALGPIFLLKVSHPEEESGVIDFQTRLLAHLTQSRCTVPTPEILKTLYGSDQLRVKLADGRTSVIRLLSFLQGTPIGDANMSDEIALDMAAKLADIDSALANFFHPSARHHLLWDISQADQLIEYCQYISKREEQELARAALVEFVTFAKPRLHDVRWQVIFNDLNPHNVLINTGKPSYVSGIIDFGDAIFAPRIIDLAVALSYQIADSYAPLQRAEQFIHQYSQTCPLDLEELDLLAVFIKTRLAATLSIASWRATIHPDNKDYILRNVPRSIKALEILSDKKTSELTTRFVSAASRAASLQPQPQKKQTDAQTLTTKRIETLGPAYRLFYENPIELIYAKGVWMYNRNGRAYLDAYNNVMQIGHCHPKILDAINAQMALINTHTRYLHSGVLRYSERLLATFAGDLNAIMLTCTGSEANDLALRIAASKTGGSGIVVSDWAYHGGTTAVTAASPSYNLSQHHPDHIRTIAPPGSLVNDTPERFARNVGEAFEDLNAAGHSACALLIDPLFTSDGIYPDSNGALTKAACVARQAGAVVIMDEVQSGFGRTGTLWYAPVCGVNADIVTLGKSMGAGYPLAGLVTRKELLDQFAQAAKYFNTYGGNPVASAAGNAVLDILENEHLVENARIVGGNLTAGLQSISQEIDILSFPRSAGMMIGITVYNMCSGRPDAKLADTIVNKMKDEGILISAVRAHLKIRPPLTFNASHIDQLLSSLRCVVQNLS